MVAAQFWAKNLKMYVLSSTIKGNFKNQIKVTLKLTTTRDYRDGSIGKVVTE